MRRAGCGRLQGLGWVGADNKRKEKNVRMAGETRGGVAIGGRVWTGMKRRASGNTRGTDLGILLILGWVRFVSCGQLGVTCMRRTKTRLDCQFGSVAVDCAAAMWALAWA
ncbi:hypothetical protein RirG_100570 [Rhizophagus irregularis DAOM 197198w]|uniref:Uncharacterized protein n=1 Tax=Rhizophagus irregularis (strain DAOM 197198w) TaxID=1432141 RepID=A0A015KN07_RHIIW|nr:hypothetical protein RirG_100570 [Rhizophagus irregularis DAOM 197198w]